MWNARYGMAAAFIAGMALFAVGCTGSGADSGRGGTAQASGASGGGAKEEDGYKYRQCLRDNGVDVEEPKEGQAAGVKVDDEKKFKKAQEACKDLPGAGREMSQDEQEKALDQAVKMAQCMREHGVDVPDPQLRDGRLTSTVGGGADVSRETMEKAQKACSDQHGQ
ncbi:hypothetical protein [Streptomyces sp. FH025]|uniref:hypothetical protein n=1 Tax=Streptomyces sp. FH025 TaxID=2815937 RepID=UPI001A9E40FB|nr:hypothetical protein [Streptomyces sp. FH025]MBO1413274.1 hypothetical protein [Streptomyces sp. FH025]